MARLRLDPTPLAAFSIADEDKVPAPIRNIRDLYEVLFEQKKITQRADAFNKWRDTFDKINDWEEMMLVEHENSNPVLKNTAMSMIRKRNYDNDQINRFYMRNINDRRNIPDVFTGINSEINKNKINMHLAERNLGRNLMEKEWDTLSKLDRDNRISEVEIIDNPVSENQKRNNNLIKQYENAHHKQTNFNTELQKRASQPGFEFLNYGPKVMSKFK